MKVVSEKVGTQKMSVLTNLVSRSKIGAHPEVTRTYPHWDKILFCFQFSLAYVLLMNHNKFADSDFIFHEFAHKINYNTSEEAKKESQRSNLYKYYADQLLKFARSYESDDVVFCESDKYDDEDYSEDDKITVCPDKPRGHQLKKAGVNSLAELFDCQMISFRCGWLTQHVHTLFDYVHNTARKDSK